MGFVVADIAAAMPKFVRSMAAEWDGTIIEDPLQRVKVAFMATRAGDAQIELVQPVGESSPVQRFLQQGGGMHHLCYEVAELEAELTAFRSRGAVIASRPKPAVAFGGRRIAWVITSEKFLVELLEEKLG
jgi:methylmalonyl-CoA/ethylmalonyl-CoA epimerase